MLPKMQGGRRGAFAIIEMVIAWAIVELFGVGGGMILVPAFYYAFFTLGYAHQDLMQICLAIISLRSLSAHKKRGSLDWDDFSPYSPF